MRVVVAGWLLTNEPSGVNRRMLATLAELPALLDAGEEVVVLHQPAWQPPTRLSGRHGLRWQPIDLPAGPAWRRTLAERRLPAVLASLAADVFDQGFLPLARGIGSRTCLTIHDLRDLGTFGRRNRWLSRMVVTSACRRASAVIVPSRFVAQQVEAISNTPVHVIAAGVDIPGDVAPSLDVGFLHVGHLEPRKNLPMLLRAFAAFARSSVPPTRLTLIGRDAGCEHDLRALAAELGVTDLVRFAGIVDDIELQACYAGCIALLFPSMLEGFGMPALEALAHGRPVVVSDRAALQEVVGDSGIVLAAEDIEAWRRTMAQLSQGPCAEYPARRAHAARFSWSRCAKETLTVWRQIAAAIDGTAQAVHKA